MLKEKIEEELDRLVSEKVIEPVKSSKWAAPIVPVVKQDGKIRICGDNKLTANPVSELYLLTTLKKGLNNQSVAHPELYHLLRKSTRS